ncbi:MAG: LamG domain-containing protein [bacterium]|nr:LamG domain-containing protein [bacterium]
MAGERSDKLLRISNFNKGITVLELLLTIALSAIIFTAIYGVFISGLKVWEVENPKSLVQQEAGFAMNRIERELKKASNITVALDTAMEFGTFPLNSPPVDSYTVSLWHFNDGSGMNAVDTAGNNNVSLGPVGSTPAWTTNGEDCTALNFDGSNDYVDCGNGATLNITSKLELEAWIRPDPGNATGAIFYKTAAYRLYLNSSNKLVGSIYYSGAWHDAISSSQVIRNGTSWAHTALSYNKDEGGTEELKVYINGVIEGTADNSDFIAVSSNNLYIGRDQDSTQYPFAGIIDEARVSNNVRRSKISWTGAGDKLTLAVNDRSFVLEGGYTTTFQISYYDTGYNLLTMPGGTDTQTKRNTIKSVKILMGLEKSGETFNLENIITLRREVSRAPASSDTTITALWHMDENNWNGLPEDVLDNSGNGINGASKNGPTTTIAGKLGRAGIFDGIDDYVDIPNSSLINTGGPYSNRTIALWFRADSTTARQVLYEEGDSARGFNIYLLSDKLYAGGWDIGDYSPDWTGTWHSTDVRPDTWYHVTLLLNNANPIVEANKFKAYIFGNEFGNGSGGRVYSHSGNVRIAMNGNTRFHDGGAGNSYFKGRIDEVVIYNSALSTAEIRNISGFSDYTKNLFDSGTYNSTSYSTDHVELSER